MSTISPDSDLFHMFDHLLSYQKTPEFRAACAPKPRTDEQRAKGREASARYHQRYPNATKLREEAEKRKPELFKLQHGLCRWCNRTLGKSYHVDHIVPIAKGGTSELSNLCVCHGRCNRKKSAKTLTQLRLF